MTYTGVVRKESQTLINLTLRFLEIRILRRGGRESYIWNLKRKIHRLSSILKRRILIYFIQNREIASSNLSAYDLRNLTIDGVYCRTNSQSGQDLFAQLVFNGIEKCSYLEIGSSWPDEISNTYVLEIDRDWRGLSVDIDARTVNAFNKKRSNLAFVADGTSLDYEVFCQENAFEPRFDYLSVDIDPSFQSYFALKKIMSDRINFSIITFEHDKYRSGYWVQKASSILLSKGGYVRVAKDIRAKNFGKYEDWWVSSTVFDLKELARIESLVVLIRQQLQV